MSVTAAGTTFTLRTPAHIKSCHLTGSWDNYGKRYEMNAERSAPGWWTITIRFSSSMPATRYWYYVRFCPILPLQRLMADAQTVHPRWLL